MSKFSHKLALTQGKAQ